jgi:Uma2 family endonuclease
MSALPTFPAGTTLAGLRLDAEGFFALGETKDRYELIDGVVLMSPSPTPIHQRLMGRLFAWIDAYLEQLGSGAVYPDTDVRFDIQRVYRPDLSVYLSHPRSGTKARLEGAPDLIVEILSDGTRPLDLITKRQDYETFGVREYWVVDPGTGSLRVWLRQGASLNEHKQDNLAVDSAVLKGFSIDPKALRHACGLPD